MARRASNPKLDLLLQMVEKPRPAGRGWIARCPAHDDNEQSLSLAVGRNGHVMLHCFRGCDKLKILNAMGLEMSDLFENTPLKDMDKDAKSELQMAFLQAKWATAVDAMRRECLFLALVARALADGEPLDAESQRRLFSDVKFLDEAFTTLMTGPAKPHLERYKVTSEMLDKYDHMPKKSGWNDEQVSRTRGRGASESRTSRDQGRRIPARGKPPERGGRGR